MQGSFEYAVEARAAPATAARLLSDFSRHDRLHPLIVRVQVRPTAPGALRSYAIKDRLAWGPFRFPVRYHADVLHVDDSAVLTTARQFPRTTVRNETRLTPREGGVRIDVRITLTAPGVLFGYALRQAEAAHKILAERLKIALEQGEL